MPGLNIPLKVYPVNASKGASTDQLLNLRALVNALDRLSTQHIEKGIQELIDILDCRNGDADLEVDVDFEPGIEEASAQLI